MTFSGSALPPAEIGVFDSGLGGLSVLREIQRQIPNASVLYLADTANVPYGDKPIHIVRDLALQLTDHLVHAGAKLILMASGTSTVAGLDAACRRYPQLPIVGTIEPGARAAAAGPTGPIGVLATNATANSRAFTEAVQAVDPVREVIEIGCPKFVPLVETGQAGTQDAQAAAFEYLQPLYAARVQSIILGCTHFPFLLEALHHAITQIGDPAFHPIFVDPSAAAVRSAITLLPGLIKDTKKTGTVRFAATGDTGDFRHFASLLLDAPIDFVSPLTL